MRIVGIDPGSRRAGYAVIELRGTSCEVLDLGTWDLMTPSASLGTRLEILYESVGAFLEQWNPRWIGLEKAITFKNVDSSLKLSEARGVIRLAAFQTLEQADQRLLEISPTAIKKHSTGLGSISKAGVSRSMSMRFPGLAAVIAGRDLKHDAFDALGIAWTTHILKSRISMERTLR